MKRWYVSLPEGARWSVAFVALVPFVVVVSLVTDDSWIGWLLTAAASFCCGWLAGVVADHFAEGDEQA